MDSFLPQQNQEIDLILKVFKEYGPDLLIGLS